MLAVFVNPLFMYFSLSVSRLIRVGVPGAVTNGQISCVAREMVMRRQVSESSEAGSPASS